MDRTEQIKAGAKALAVHRWKTMGVNSCECECGEIVFGNSALTEFPADEALRLHLAKSVLDAASATMTKHEIEDLWWIATGDNWAVPNAAMVKFAQALGIEVRDV